MQEIFIFEYSNLVQMVSAKVVIEHELIEAENFKAALKKALTRRTRFVSLCRSYHHEQIRAAA